MYTPTAADRTSGSAALRRRQAIGRGLARLLGRVETVGLENLPSGAVLLAGNHRSALDGPLIFVLTPRPVTFLVKDEAFVGPVAPLLRGAGQLPVVRQRVDRAPIRMSVRILRAGGAVGIFPEGTRGDGLAGTARPGVGYLALRSGACVVPVACHGTELMAHRRQATRPFAQVVFGAPIPFTRYPDGVPLNRRVVAEAAERVRVALAGLVTDTAPDETRAAA